MYTSVRWLNDYLDPPATAEEQADLLTRAGFPLEGSETVSGGDVRQDFEMTSNRGDCVCHVGLAREIAALSERTLKRPAAAPVASGPPATEFVRIVNHEPGLCPLYTARIIRGVKVGPSPAWLAGRLAARGDIPRNNIVDATNFVLFELGQPTHVFDLARLRGGEINIRLARAGEPFLPIGEDAREIRLSAEDLVIADAGVPVALAGVKGGGLSAVTAETTDVLLEAATFDPVSVRRSSRRHNIASDSSYRFERGVHPAQIEAAADRLAALILDLAGGDLAEGVVADGAAIPPAREASMRPDRCRKLLGLPVDDEAMLRALERLGFQPAPRGDRIHCTVPPCRLDVEREVDLIEEVGRVFGHDRIPVTETVRIAVAPPQPRELAKRAVHDALIGMGFVESVTHSLIAEDAARPFLRPGESLLRLEDDRPGDSVLRPSLLPSLLRVRAHNRRHGVERLRLFESAHVFRLEAGGGHVEEAVLGLVADQVDPQAGLRPLRGVIDRVAEVVLGHDALVEAVADGSVPWYEPAAALSAGGGPIGHAGLVSERVRVAFDLSEPILAAELRVARHYDGFPPGSEARGLPSHPAIERDVSAIVAEPVAWSALRRTCAALELEHMEALEYVTVFRGRQVGEGRKSLTLRCRFRAPDRTLRHDEVDPQMTALVEALKKAFDAEIRE